MRKAGWDGGGSTARRLLRGAAGGNSSATKPWDQVSDFRTVRYQGLKASASYAEWQEWRGSLSFSSHIPTLEVGLMIVMTMMILLL